MSEPQPRAERGAEVVAGCVRITVLTSRMARMEFASDGTFEDRPTLAVVNRRTPVPEFTSHTTAKSLTVTTPELTIVCSDVYRPFSAATLTATFRVRNEPVTWRYGDRDRANPGGTMRTLDGFDGDRRSIRSSDGTRRSVRADLGQGLVSPSGWAVIDDSHGVVIDEGWASRRPAGKRQDIYLLAYGLDFKAALGDAAMLLGPQPLPPRFALGYWYSKWWAYTDTEIEQLVEQFDTMRVPLDVVVVDMDWHKPGWTGYSWDPAYFPDPADFLRWLHDRDLKVALNLHPSAGVGSHEDAFEAMCADLGLNPHATDRIEFDCTDRRFMDAYFRHLHHPIEDQGVDFWWMDWQQGTESGLEGLDPLPWLNRLHWQDQQQRRPERRSLNFSRYGGLGSHRYPVGFSGDTHATWKSLAYQAHFTATAANVGFGWWSHDIGGFRGPEVTPELYTRWVQLGVYSPVLRTHSTKSHEHERRVWQYREPYGPILVDAIRRRYELVPYLYTEARKGMDTGLCVVRPMYHEWPHLQRAHQARGQFVFGDHLLVAPVTRPVDARDDAAAVEVFLPPGRWYDTALGRTEHVDDPNGSIVRRRYFLDETPVFARAGSVVPGQRDAQRLRPGAYTDLLVTVYSGDPGEYTLYEDDGISTAYLDGSCAWIPVTHEAGRIRIGPARGRYEGFTSTRSLQVRMVGVAPPRGVRAGRSRLPWSARPAPGTWSYDGMRATVVVNVAQADVTRGLTVAVEPDSRAGASMVEGLPGLLAGLRQVAALVQVVSPVVPMHPQERLAVRASQAGYRIARQPARFVAEVEQLQADVRALPAALHGFRDAYRKASRLPEQARARGADHLTKALAILKTTTTSR